MLFKELAEYSITVHNVIRNGINSWTKSNRLNDELLPSIGKTKEPHIINQLSIICQLCLLRIIEELVILSRLRH